VRTSCVSKLGIRFTVILFDVNKNSINSFLFYVNLFIVFLSVASPGNTTEQLITQGAFKIRSGQVGTPMVHNGDPNSE